MAKKPAQAKTDAKVKKVPAKKKAAPKSAVAKPKAKKAAAKKVTAPVKKAPKPVAKQPEVKPAPPVTPPPASKAAIPTPPKVAVPTPPKPAAPTPTPPPPPPAAAAPKPATPPPAPSEPPKPAPEPEVKFLQFETPIALKELAIKLGVKSNELIVNLMAKNVFATINQNLGEDIVVSILKGYGFEYKQPEKIESVMVAEHKELEEKQDARHLETRPPVVTFMGHVDHGKTSLLDYIRKASVADKEKGGITQHIGAYEVHYKNGSVTFLDTPGHEAFTAMRARGANATDVVVLVVAADDGVMPQTKEALDHARAAGSTIVVAINKCDLPSANIDKVKAQLSQVGLNPEDWGGTTITLPVSAKTGEGVDHLLEMLLLESELLELKANPQLRARGVVIEGKLSSGQGAVSTVLVKNGTLRSGDMVLIGMYYGRVKAMMNHAGKRIDAAGPSQPAIILGLSGGTHGR